LTDLFDESGQQFVALELDHGDPVGQLLVEFNCGLDGLGALDVSRRLTTIEARIATISGVGKIYGRDFDDLVALKYLYQRYSNYLHWLEGGLR
jgi:MoxR-like ATPase